MKIWNGTNTIDLDKSIAEDLLFSIIAETPDKELLPFEKLFVALNSGISCHPRILTDVYMACGCFNKAKEAYINAGHTRKLGDICWIQGNLDEAESYYLNPKSSAQSYRTQPDYDRLIKLSFVCEQWSAVIRRFVDASFKHGVSENQIICGSSEMSRRPFLEMLAVALTMLNQDTPTTVQTILTSAFDFSPKQWYEFRSNPTFAQETTIRKIKKRCLPVPAKIPQVLLKKPFHEETLSVPMIF
jgi:hypothetical protein